MFELQYKIYKSYLPWHPFGKRVRSHACNPMLIADAGNYVNLLTIAFLLESFGSVLLIHMTHQIPISVLQPIIDEICNSIILAPKNIQINIYPIVCATNMCRIVWTTFIIYWAIIFLRINIRKFHHNEYTIANRNEFIAKFHWSKHFEYYWIWNFDSNIGNCKLAVDNNLV